MTRISGLRGAPRTTSPGVVERCWEGAGECMGRPPASQFLHHLAAPSPQRHKFRGRRDLALAARSRTLCAAWLVLEQRVPGNETQTAGHACPHRHIIADAVVTALDARR